MKWGDAVQDRKAKKTFVDKQKASSLVLMSDEILELFSSITISEKNASSVMSNYYEALREVVEAVCLLNGWNVYSHEAFTCFLSDVLKDDFAAQKFDRFRKVRNGINYYGRKISAEESLQNKEDVIKLIDDLKNKYLGDL